jgi:hypothetical protein
MKTVASRLIAMRLEMVLVAFLVLAVLSALVIYVADPSLYASSLSLTSTLTDRYPAPVTLLLVGVVALTVLLILGVVRHWRWVFWLTLVALGSSALHIPVTLLQIVGILPTAYPLWYSLLQLGVAFIEIGIAVWMIQIYRHQGVWAMEGNKNKGRS